MDYSVSGQLGVWSRQGTDRYMTDWSTLRNFTTTLLLDHCCITWPLFYISLTIGGHMWTLTRRGQREKSITLCFGLWQGWNVKLSLLRTGGLSATIHCVCCIVFKDCVCCVLTVGYIVWSEDNLVEDSIWELKLWDKRAFIKHFKVDEKYIWKDG